MTENENQPLGKLVEYIDEAQKQHRNLKPQLDQIEKNLAVLGYKPGDMIDAGKLPIDAPFVELVKEQLKGGGKNVKTLQKALGIFDYAEMTRKRKALQAAGVTRETENYSGSNATFIELNVT